MKKLLFLILLICPLAHAQVGVTLSPWPRMQFLNASGSILSGGLVYTYVSGTSTPQATYTDSTGTTQNSNPVTLDSTGSAQIWLASGLIYRMVVTDSNNVQQWSVDGITGAPNLLSPGPIGTTVPNVVESTQFLSATALPALSGLIRLANADSICFRNAANSLDLCMNAIVGDLPRFSGHPFAFLDLSQTFTGAPNFSGGGTLSGTWSGSPTFSGNPIFSLAPTFSASPGFVVSSSTVIPNLNASQLLGNTWSVPAPIGNTTPNTGSFSTLVVGTSPAQTGTSGNGTKLGTTDGSVNAASAGTPLCSDGSGNVSANISTPICHTTNGGRNTSVCSTGTNTTCPTTVNLFRTEPDTNYAATATCVGPTQFPFILGISKTTTTVTVTLSPGTASQAQISTCTEIDVTVTR